MPALASTSRLAQVDSEGAEREKERERETERDREKSNQITDTDTDTDTHIEDYESTDTDIEDYERECFTDCTTDDPVSHTRVVLEAAGPS